MYVDIFNFLWSVAQLLLTFAVRSKWSTFVVLYVSQYSHALSTKQKNIELINVFFVEMNGHQHLYSYFTFGLV